VKVGGRRGKKGGGKSRASNAGGGEGEGGGGSCGLDALRYRCGCGLFGILGSILLARTLHVDQLPLTAGTFTLPSGVPGAGCSGSTLHGNLLTRIRQLT